MQIVCIEDNLHEMLNLFSEKNKKNISECCLLKILPRVLSFNFISFQLRFNGERTKMALSNFSPHQDG